MTGPMEAKSEKVEAHTPGPWLVFDHYCGRDPETAGEYAGTRLIGLGQYDTIAEVRQGSDDVPGDVDANARLIAAAPELLSECEDALDTFEKLRAFWVEEGSAGRFQLIKVADAHIADLRAAIASATGGAK